MDRTRLAGIATIGVCALTMLSASTLHARKPSLVRQIDECNLLSVADASVALEQKSQPGKHMTDGTPPGCIWSADPKMSDSSRRIAVNAHSQRAFTFAKAPAITTIKIEPVSGLGDEAFYQIYPNGQSPFIWVRKGSNSISIRIMGTKTNGFSLDQDKAKELVLAKAALAKL
jgi:hypothetical protein